MQEIGAELKQLREQKGFTLDEVQQATKIRSRYLEAIEEGDLDALPGTVYARGFIKSYAEFLGTNGQELLDRFGGVTGDAEPEPIETPRSEKVKESNTKAPKASKSPLFAGSRLFPQIVAGALVIAVLGVGYYFLVNHGAPKQTVKEPAAKTQQEAGQTVSQNATPPVAVTPKPAPVKPVEPPKPNTVIAVQDQATNQTLYSVTGPQNLTLQVSASSDCWVEVKADGKTVESGIVKNGETKSYTADKSLSILTGRSKYLTMKVNDQKVAIQPLLRGYTYAFQLKS